MKGDNLMFDFNNDGISNPEELAIEFMIFNKIMNGNDDLDETDEDNDEFGDDDDCEDI